MLIPSRVRLASALVLPILLATACVAPPEPEPRGDGPSIVVLIVIDQGRQDYLERFRPLMSGGLAWLLDNGAVFTDAHHNHSMTATAPGHAALATGRVPAKNGIYSNYWYDVEALDEMYSGGESSDPSPMHLWGTTFGDWLKERDNRSKVITASPKDRAAVLMGGQRADAAISYWSSTGAWWTGDYYAGSTGDWFDAFVEEERLDRYFGTLWEPLVADAEIWAQYDVVQLDTGAFSSGFPYPIGRPDVEPDSGFYRSVYSTPMMDEYLAELAVAMIDGEQLGLDGSVDFLALSFSATDAVGHGYGPNSPEILDTTLRLDGYLGSIIEHLEATVGLEHVLFALSSDHGVATLPEYLALVDQGESGKRLDAGDVQCIQNAGARFRERFGDADWFLDSFYLDPAVVAAQGTTVAAVESALAALLEECEAVDKVWTSTELTAEPATDDDVMKVLHRNSHVPGRAPNLVAQLVSGYLYYPGQGTSHGTAHPYDTHVPLIIAGPGVAARVIEQRVHTVDLAPTLAALLGITPPDDLDGVDRSQLIRD